jgi:hypothetical protein
MVDPSSASVSTRGCGAWLDMCWWYGRQHDMWFLLQSALWQITQSHCSATQHKFEYKKEFKDLTAMGSIFAYGWRNIYTRPRTLSLRAMPHSTPLPRSKLWNCSMRYSYSCKVDLHDYILHASDCQCLACPALMADSKPAWPCHGSIWLISEGLGAVKSEHTASTKIGTSVLGEISKAEKCTMGIST